MNLRLLALLLLALCSVVGVSNAQEAEDVENVNEEDPILTEEEEKEISLLEVAARKLEEQEKLLDEDDEEKEPQELKIVLEDDSGDVEYVEGGQALSKQRKKSEPYRYRGYGSYRGYGGHGSHAYRGGYRGYNDGYGYGYGHGHAALAPVGSVRTRVSVQRRVLRPRVHHAGAVLPGDGFEGSYVAVSGRPGERTVHAVNGRGSVASEYDY